MPGLEFLNVKSTQERPGTCTLSNMGGILWLLSFIKLETCILPIGQYSEEAQEARNKHNRQLREQFTRKTSRMGTNTDLLNRLLIISYPTTASLRACPKTKHIKMNPELLNLLES